MAAYDLAASSEINRRMLHYTKHACKEARQAAALIWAINSDATLMDFDATVSLAKQACEAVRDYLTSLGPGVAPPVAVS